MTLEDYLTMTSDHLNSDAGSTSSEVEDDDSSCHSVQASATSWGTVLAGALRRASRQGRLTCGVTASARALERGDDSVRLCVLAPTSASGGLLHLHSVLLEAHCYENGIPTLKVDSVEKLAAIVGPSCECVLIHKARVLASSKPLKYTTSLKGHGYNGASGTKKSESAEKGLLAAARDGTHPTVLVLPVSPPP